MCERSEENRYKRYQYIIAHNTVVGGRRRGARFKLLKDLKKFHFSDKR